MKKTVKPDPATKPAAPIPPETKRRPTINDVARLANVSKKTVSRVINQSPFVNKDTRERIEVVISQLGYAPDPVARGLASRRSYLIGLVYNTPDAQHLMDTQQGIIDIIRGSGLELLVYPCSREDESFVSDVRGFVDRQKLAGVILPSPISENEALVAMLKESETPYVRIASALLDTPGNSVVTPDREGARRAADHLAGLGHRVIAHVAGPDSLRSSQERRAGFVHGLGTAGLSLNRKLDLRGDHTFESGIEAGRRLMAATPRPTAVFCDSDAMAAGVCQAIREARLEAGKDVSVVGFENSPVAACMWPALTTVAIPVRALARLATRQHLGDRLPSPPPEETSRDELEPRMVVRASTGPAPKG